MTTVLDDSDDEDDEEEDNNDGEVEGSPVPNQQGSH